ncbi:MAG: ArgE/DapE family deacylase [Candidatus Aminicenantes bacterium]|nr:ArgE/DapE family deacylase [Candidatus Aminicenantes bacterium]
MDIQISQSFLKDTLQKLVQINSVNPDLDSHAPGEQEIGSLIARILEDLGLEPEVETLKPGRVNVTAVVKGSSNGRSLMINGHMDTVGVGNMKEPFSGAVSDGRLYGRGAMDMKGGLAAALSMVKALMDNHIQLAGDLVLAFVADEEYASTGTERLVERYQTDAAIVTEPTGLDICTAHKGFGLFEFTTTGRAAHGSQPEEGIDANKHMGWIMRELDQMSRKLEAVSPHALLGVPSLHFPVIKGGTEPFTYAEKCRMKVERRTLPGEKKKEMLSELTAVIRRLSEQSDTFQAEVKPILWRNAYEIDQKNQIVTALIDSVKEATGRAPSYIGHPWWEDSGLLAEAGMDTVIIGPKGSGLHTKEEWVDIRSVKDLAQILVQAALNFCT